MKLTLTRYELAHLYIFNDIFLFKNVWLLAGVSIAEDEKRMKTNKTLQTIKKTRGFCDS